MIWTFIGYVGCSLLFYALGRRHGARRVSRFVDAHISNVERQLAQRTRLTRHGLTYR